MRAAFPRTTVFTAAYKDRITQHATAGEVWPPVVRSGWARRLGARTASRVTWTAKARRLAAHGSGR